MSPFLPFLVLAAGVADAPAPARVGESKPFTELHGEGGVATAVVDTEVRVLEGGDLGKGVAEGPLHRRGTRGGREAARRREAAH